MQALKDDSRARSGQQASQSADLDEVQEQIATLLMEAVSCVAAARVTDTVRGWLARLDLSLMPPAQEVALLAEALAMATIIAVFTPTAGGTTAVDRLARRRAPLAPLAATTLSAIGRTQFRVVQIETIETDGSACLRDVATAEIIKTSDDAITATLIGLHVAAWLALLRDGQHVFVGSVTPLDEAGVAVAMGFVRPGRYGLINAIRCADSVYRHVLRNGTPRIAGLNEPLPGDDGEFVDEGDELDRLAQQWAETGRDRDPEDIQFVRAETSLECIVAMLASAANTSEHSLTALSAAYASIAQIQIETMQRRAAAGSGTLRLQTVAAAVEAGIISGELSRTTRDIFAAIRQRLGAEPSARAGDRAPAEMDKLIGRIQALRAKTVAQGCTEQEALAAAAKVAELLDRYGLSLNSTCATRPARDQRWRRSASGPGRSTIAFRRSRHSSTAGSGARKAVAGHCAMSFSAYPST